MSIFLSIPFALVLTYIAMQIAKRPNVFTRKRLEKKWSDQPEAYLKKAYEDFPLWQDVRDSYLPKTWKNSAWLALQLFVIALVLSVMAIQDYHTYQAIKEYVPPAQTERSMISDGGPPTPHPWKIYMTVGMFMVVVVFLSIKRNAEVVFAKQCVKKVTGATTLEEFDKIDYTDTQWYEEHSDTLPDAYLVDDVPIGKREGKE